MSLRTIIESSRHCFSPCTVWEYSESESIGSGVCSGWGQVSRTKLWGSLIPLGLCLAVTTAGGYMQLCR